MVEVSAWVGLVVAKRGGGGVVNTLIPHVWMSIPNFNMKIYIDLYIYIT